MDNILSIVIVNFQSEDYLKKCLDSLFSKKKGGIALDIIVVNNDEEEELSWIKELFPAVRVMKNSNDSLGKSWNMGGKNSKGEIIWFLNPDTELLSSDFGKIFEEFRKDPLLAVLGPRLLTDDGKSQPWSAGVDSSLLDVILNNLGWTRSRKVWESQEKRETHWVSGAAFFISRKAFESVRGFDENIVRYFEDMDFCRRIRKGGLKTLFFPEFEIKHHCGGSHKDKKMQKVDFYASQDYYFKKHLGKAQAWILRLLRKTFLSS